MPWFGWVVVGWLALNVVYQFYLVDRPRKPKTLAEAFEAMIELGLVIWAVVELGS